MSAVQSVRFKSQINGQDGNIDITVSVVPESDLGLEEDLITQTTLCKIEEVIAKYGHLILAYMTGGISATEFLINLQVMHANIASAAAVDAGCECEECSKNRQDDDGVIH